MTNRILSLTEGAARLRIDLDRLVIERPDQPAFSCVLTELAVLLLEHPSVTLTQPVLSRIAEAGGMVVVCDGHHLPVAMLMPLQGHSVQVERFWQQAHLPKPKQKRLWQEIVRAKILAQAQLLRELNQEDAGLTPMAGRVRSGDPDNLEAQAARRYWPLVFSGHYFRREREARDQNRHLNYGYAVLRAMVARAICAAGLHPTLGLHHHNRYNAYCLADDVMEPFRPLVDRVVAQRIRAGADRGEELDHKVRAELLRPLTARYQAPDGERTLFDLLSSVASSLARVIMGEETDWRLLSIAGEAGLVPRSQTAVQLLLEDEQVPRRPAAREEGASYTGRARPREQRS